MAGRNIAKYATDASIIDVSELDGMLTAVLSSPLEVEPAEWMFAVWGGAEHVPHWATDRERDRFVNLTLQHMSDIADRLNDYPDQFEPLFGTREEEDQELTIVEEVVLRLSARRGYERLDRSAGRTAGGAG
jgi:uncharacterized protein